MDVREESWNHPSRPTPRQTSRRSSTGRTHTGWRGPGHASEVQRPSGLPPAAKEYRKSWVLGTKRRGLGKCRGRPVLRGSRHSRGTPCHESRRRDSRRGKRLQDGGKPDHREGTQLRGRPRGLAGQGKGSPPPPRPARPARTSQQRNRRGGRVPTPGSAGWGAGAAARSHDSRGAGRRLAGPHVRAAPPPRPPRAPAPPWALAPHLRQRRRLRGPACPDPPGRAAAAEKARTHRRSLALALRHD